MLIKVAFPDTMKLDKFIGKLQKFGRTSTQIVFLPLLKTEVSMYRILLLMLDKIVYNYS